MWWREAGSAGVRSWGGLAAGAAIVALLALPQGAAAQGAAAQDTTQATTGATHTVKRGDTLWDLAATYLSDAFQWPEIYRVNRDVVENPHWIYPGEVLRIPGRTALAEGDEPLPEGDVQPSRPRGAGPTVFTPVAVIETTAGPGISDRPMPTVRPGQIVAAPYVDAPDAPRDAGRILDTRELMGIDQQSPRGRYREYEEVTITLPANATGRVGERYLALERGPYLDRIGQILVPTGVLELIRAPVDGQAAIAKVNGLFGELRTEHRLVVMRGLDAPTAKAVAVPAGTGHEARIRHIVNENVLPTIGSFFIIDAASRDGMKVGDDLLIYEPRREGTAGRPDEPEIPIGRAQVVRVTEQGSTAVILGIDQPRIERGKWVRVIARMP